jgi:uncharacterized membrane protein
MEKKGLLFIPDISGFSRFVSESEIDHSRLIIQELLEVLISSNDMGLQISEIEGDAILFYKFGEPPALEDLYHQVEKMFCAFHKNLISYEYRKYCQCKACMSAIDLTLKVITHYGEFTGYTVQSFNKLIGKDIIVAHQLLKNDIAQHEYWLVTKNLLGDNRQVDLTGWMKWNNSVKQTEAGAVPFSYTQLGQLKNELSPETLQQPDLSKKAKVISVSKEYETDIISLFHASGGFNYRGRWQEGVKKVEEMNHFLPRIGMKCRCIMENGEVIIIVAGSYRYSPEKIEFSETEERDRFLMYYTLEKTVTNKIKFTLDYYIPKNILSRFIFNVSRKKEMERTLNKSLQNLVGLVKEIRL